MAKKNLRRGILITFEGPEGSGKTTHARLLFDHLRRLGYTLVRTREPGGTALGEGVRKTLLHSGGMKISDLTELFLFEACRAQVVDEVIRPALAKRKAVICDRFSDATFAYQGSAGGVPPEKIMALDRVATGGIKPDLTILLDVDTATGLERASGKGLDRMEKKDTAYHRRVREGYLKLAKREPGRIKVIKALGDIGRTQRFVRREAELVIQRYKRTG